MELDELKARWVENEGKLDEVLRINRQFLQDSRTRTAESALKWASGGILLEQMASILTVILLGVFMANHSSEPRYLVPAAVLDFFAILSGLSSGYQLGTLHRIDFGRPVVAIQKRLERVRILRLATTKWALLLGPVLWVPLAIVALHGLLGVDGYAVFPGPWLAVNLVAGAALSVALYGMSRRFASRMGGSPLVRRLMNDIAGRSLSRAVEFLHGISDFEREGGLG